MNCNSLNSIERDATGARWRHRTAFSFEVPSFRLADKPPGTPSSRGSLNVETSAGRDEWPSAHPERDRELPNSATDLLRI
jgi:hypothetical protein